MPPRFPDQVTSYVNSVKIGVRVDSLVAGCSLTVQALTKFMGYGLKLIAYLKQPRESEIELLIIHRLTG